MSDASAGERRAETTAGVDASVVIPVRDGASTIVRQLHALAAQEDVDASWEIVVSDNGSRDETREAVLSESRRLPVPVRVVDAGSRPGLSHARNVGVLHARGEFVLFCDADDIVRRRWLSSAIRGLRASDVVGGDIHPFESEAQLGSEPPRGLISASFGPAIIGCNFGLRRAAYLAIGGCDESLPPYGCEDAELSVRANDAGLRIVSVPGMEVDFQKTLGLRANLRKAYLSGVAQAIVFARHPERYAAQSGAHRALRDAVTLPVRMLRARERVTARSALRQYVSALGLLAGSLGPARPSRLGRPMLLDASRE